mgnify:CR=1 FL=1
MIEFKNVSKVYDNGSVALDQVSLQIGKGEFVFVVGASGAGKSTLIRLLSHEELPTKGSVFVNDIEVNRLAKKSVPYLRRKMGIVFQDFRLLPNKTAQENVAFAMEVIEAPRRVIRRRVREVLDLVGLIGKADACRKPQRRGTAARSHCQSHRQSAAFAHCRRTDREPRSRYVRGYYGSL